MATPSRAAFDFTSTVGGAFVGAGGRDLNPERSTRQSASGATREPHANHTRITREPHATTYEHGLQHTNPR
ncbi:hypothetical protein AArcSl_2163 [Halalkaliarchaeum desulfuricum]|uniref:Uncharacterized protein n=1 Tax=Halalkaliarchaeum desulfuricum TaxID=2055893 RepID=A0A343TL16_9EURY|nr:hypothetical protein AArcSl_2163 [Halalkaliarchaeum desulfuricum]